MSVSNNTVQPADPAGNPVRIERVADGLCLCSFGRLEADECEILTCVGFELDDDLPEWIHLFPSEPFWHPKLAGIVPASLEMCEKMAANFKLYVNEMVVDYEHQSMADPPVEAPAAAWIDDVKVMDGGLFGHVREWLGRARTYLSAREYRYISPVFSLLARDRRSGETIGPALLSAGLTNVPHIDGLTPLVNRTEPDEMPTILLATIAAALSLAETSTEDEILASIDALKKRPEQELPDSVIEALHLENGASGETACSAIVALKTAGQAAKERADNADVQVQQLQASISGAGTAAKGTVSVQEYAKLQGEHLKLQAKHQVMVDGVAPAAQDLACSVYLQGQEQYAEYIKTAPRVDITRIHTPKHKPAAGRLTAEQLAMCRMSGLTEEEYSEALATATES